MSLPDPSRWRTTCRELMSVTSGRLPRWVTSSGLLFVAHSQTLAAYDEDAGLTIDALIANPACTGRVAVTGMCLGGHLAFRAALDPRVAAGACYFATDLHSHSLGEGKNDDSLSRAGEIRGELLMVRARAGISEATLTASQDFWQKGHTCTACGTGADSLHARVGKRSL